MTDTDVFAEKVILQMELEKARAEAIKEFAEEYKDQIKDCTGMFTDDGFYVPLEAALNAVDFIKEKLMGVEDDDE